MKDDVISRQAAIKHLKKRLIETAINNLGVIARCDSIFEDTADNRIGPWINELPSAQPEHLTDDDFETIRIHLSAFKESLCNQCRWKEAEDYERLISRFMSFASAQPYTDEEIQKMPTIELDRTAYGMNGWNKKNERGTVVNCLLDKCDYNQDCICTREEITLSEEHYCVGGCDDGWKIKEEDDED